MKLSGNLDKLVDPTVFKCENFQLEHIIFWSRLFGRTDSIDKEAAKILSNILSHLNPHIHLSEELIKEELLKSLIHAQSIAQTEDTKNFIKKMITNIPEFIEFRVPYSR